jgi:ribosome biogenesis GTPase
MDNLTQLGFDHWFYEKVDLDRAEDLEIARIVEVHKDSFIISKGIGETFAELVGKFLYSADTMVDFPTVGDWVTARFYDDDISAVIHQILPRKSLLKRKTPGKKIDFQLIAANLDIAFIMQSLDANFNLNRLERYLAIVYESDIRPIILLSKSDLIAVDEIHKKVAIIHNSMPGLDVLWFSNQDRSGLNKIKDLFLPGQTYCLLGSSGVGKTTLLNNLIGESRYVTKEVRGKDGRGRHATTQRQLIRLESGALLIDTPGMREIGIFSAETGIDEAFLEITGLAKQCQFNDCSHDHETGCAVLQALEEGSLSQQRYQNFLKIKKEANHYERSYLEKRKRDKEFGKMVKSIMKHKKKRK